MKKQILYILLTIILPSNLLLGQNEPIYMNFEDNSEEYYWQIGEMGEKLKGRSFLKNKASNGDIDFYIQGLLFRYDASEMAKKMIKDAKSTFSGKAVLSPKEVKDYIKKIQEKYPLGYTYPSEEYPKLFIVNRKDDIIVLYEVKWQYYTE